MDMVEYIFIGILIIGLLVIVNFLLITSFKNKISILEMKIKSMRSVINQIANQIEIPENPINNELRKLLKEGQEVEAIKKARQSLGLSLLEAKEYIDNL